jgi:hypothetical protein
MDGWMEDGFGWRTERSLCNFFPILLDDHVSKPGNGNHTPNHFHRLEYYYYHYYLSLEFDMSIRSDVSKISNQAAEIQHVVLVSDLLATGTPDPWFVQQLQ